MTTLASLGPAPAQAASPAVNYHLNRPGYTERVVVFLALFTYTWGTPPQWFQFATTGATESSLLTQAVFLSFLGCSVVALNGNWHVTLAAAKREPLLPMFVGLSIISAAWSTLPILTLRDNLVIAVAYVMALHLVVRFSMHEILQLLAWVFGIGAVLNLVFVVIFEGGLGGVSLATASDGGDNWSGVTTNRNTLGRDCVLGYVVCVLYARTVKSWILWPGMAALNVLIVLGTNSATSLGATLGISVLGLVFLGFRGRKTLYGATMVAMSIVFGTLTLLAATNLATFTGLLGRDSSFTGRLPIWQDAFEFGVSERPLLGYGAGGFWQHGIADFDVQLRAGTFNVQHSHNAWIDAWLELGPLGVLILTGIYLRGLLWSTRRIRAVPRAIGMFPALVVALGVIFSTTEAGFVSRAIRFIMLVVAITVAAEHKGKEEPFDPDGDERGDDSLPAMMS